MPDSLNYYDVAPWIGKSKEWWDEMLEIWENSLNHNKKESYSYKRDLKHLERMKQIYNEFFGDDVIGALRT